MRETLTAEMKKYALIVAGGKGTRMGNQLPKQFIPLGDGRPVLMSAIEAFYLYDPQIRIILVLPEEQRLFWLELCEKHSFPIPHEIVSGGKTRFHSVRNGLSLLEEEAGIVGIHDGVRPFVSQEVIARCYSEAERHRAVVPVVALHETLRLVENGESRTVDRDRYRLVQTPQVFHNSVLQQAYRQSYTEGFTDDASVVEAMGVAVRLTEGNPENIKITTPLDLKIASALLPDVRP